MKLSQQPPHQPEEGQRAAQPPGAPESDAWRRALDAAASLYIAAGALQADEDKTLVLLTDALRGDVERRKALLLLSYLDTSYTLALADLLVERALSQRDALLVRQLFGRLEHYQIVDTVPAAVLRLLDEIGDDDAYRRMAELLQHLGLTSALNLIIDRAMASDDIYVREVGAEYAPDSA